MNWRKWNNILHRDLGYIAFGLTLIYAISGIFLNHKRDINPNYIIENSSFSLNNPGKNLNPGPEDLTDLLKKNRLETDFKGSFKPEPGIIQVFYSGKTVTLDLKQGIGSIETIRNRKVVREMNLLHLNTPGKIWTYIADLYALILIMLSITGLFVLKGKKGIRGRGKWLTAAGFIIPLIFVIIYA